MVLSYIYKKKADKIMLLCSIGVISPFLYKYKEEFSLDLFQRIERRIVLLPCL